MVDRSQNSSRDGEEKIAVDDGSVAEKTGEGRDTTGSEVPVGPLDWDGPDDVDNPWNWSPVKRWYGTIVPGLLCLLVFVAPCQWKSVSMGADGWQDVFVVGLCTGYV